MRPSDLRSRYLELATVLNEGLNVLEEKFCETDLPLKQQHWAMFSALEAYLCLWQCGSLGGYPKTAAGMLQARRPCSLRNSIYHFVSLLLYTWPAKHQFPVKAICFVVNACICFWSLLLCLSCSLQRLYQPFSSAHNLSQLLMSTVWCAYSNARQDFVQVSHPIYIKL